MKPIYINRTVESLINKAVNEFPALILTGPRQAGKTTTLKHLFNDTHRYVSLDPPDIRASAKNDPRAFLALYPPPVIIDEIQHVPELLSFIKERIDSQRHLTGRYLLTGSQNRLLLEQVSESLAGRIAVVKLMPLSRRELDRQPERLFPWEAEEIPAKTGLAFSYDRFWRRMIRGWYPEVAIQEDRDSRFWFSSYVQTYLEHDLRNVRQVGDLSLFQDFLRLLAARTGQIVSYSGISRDLGIAVNTVKAWISVLEASHLVVLVWPYYANIGKRLIKSPKIYFTDVGLVCFLSGVREPEQAMSGPMAGQLVETLVFSEIYKGLMHRGEERAVYFWRTATGVEVDFLIPHQGRLVPIEVKGSATPAPRWRARSAGFANTWGICWPRATSSIPETFACRWAPA